MVVKDRIRKFLRDLQREKGTTIILTTHDKEAMKYFIDSFDISDINTRSQRLDEIIRDYYMKSPS